MNESNDTKTIAAESTTQPISNLNYGKFKSLDDLRSGYENIEKKIGGMMSIPSDDDESHFKAYDRLGRPQDKKYADDELRSKYNDVDFYEELFYNSGLTSKQGKALLNQLSGMSETAQAEFGKAIELEKEKNIRSLHEKHGEKLEEKIRLTQAITKKYGSPELETLLEESNYNPAAMDFIINIAQTMSPDSLVTGSSSGSGKEWAQSEIAKYRANSEFMSKYTDANAQGHEDTAAIMRNLYNQLNQ